jgi:endoglucanase
MKGKILIHIRINLLIFLLSQLAAYSQDIVKIETASNNVFVVHLETEWININAYNRSTLYDDVKPSRTGWFVNGKEPKDIGLYTVVIDQKAVNQQYYPIKLKHKIYLILDDELYESETYNITSPYGDTTFTFNEKYLYCESIKVNQVGYAHRSSVRHANFGIFMGDKGSVQLPELPTYEVLDSLSGENVTSGILSYWGDDTGNQKAQSGEHVYRIDLSSLSEGAYYIVVKGIGRSHYFGVGTKYSSRIASTHLRGMYHQRCGIALEQPFTQYERGICHQEVAFTKYEGESEGQGWIHVPQGSQMHKIKGGYHDAGDYDRRTSHTKIPLLMLNYYEAFQSHFTDNQYNIPESGNGIPDFLDEAMWSVLIWEYLQLDESNSDDPDEYGGVMGGTETSRHPTYGRDRADWENSGNQVYGTYAIYESTTLASIGFFAQAARLIAPYDSAKYLKLLERAELAWNYAERNSFNDRLGFKMYAALQMYLTTATGDFTEDMANKFHLIFRDLARRLIVQGGYWPYQYLPGNHSARIFTSHFISYLINEVPKDENLANLLMQSIQKNADNGGYMEWTPEKYPYAQGATKYIGWGAALAQGRYADPAAFMYRLSKNEQEKQKYYNLVSQFGDYSLGLNPLGKSFVTGLGDDQVQSPLHLDSYWTKYGKTPFSGNQPAIGNVPGIVIFGFTESRSNAKYQTAVSDFLYPIWEEMPGQRRWTDGWSLVNSNEFTVHETMVWNTCMYAVLYSAQKNPISNAGAVLQNKSDNLIIFPNPVKDQLTVQGEFEKGIGHISIINDNGQMVYKKKVNIQNKEVKVNNQLRQLKSGTYIIHIQTSKKKHSGKFIKK